MLEKIGYLGKLDNPDNLKKLIERLPYTMRAKWRETVDRIIEREARDVTIKDINEFVTAEQLLEQQLTQSLETSPSRNQEFQCIT